MTFVYVLYCNNKMSFNGEAFTLDDQETLLSPFYETKQQEWYPRIIPALLF